MSQLTVLDCEGCGACCRHIGTPPGFSNFHVPAEHAESARVSAWGDDALYHDSAPEEARKILSDYYAALWAGEIEDRTANDDQPCLWLGPDGRCRFHAHRPEICRDFEIGEEDCLRFRGEQGIVTIGGKP